MTVLGTSPIARAAADAVVQRDQVEHVEVLPLVLVEPLDLDVEQRLRIDDDAGALPDQGGQPVLVGGLDRAPLGLKLGVGRPRLDQRQLRLEIRDPLVADGAREQRCQPGVAEHDPPARRHAVGDVAELLG